MNLSHLSRAIQRPRYMDDEVAYTALLEHAATRSGVWYATQSEYMEFWAARERSSLSVIPEASGPVLVGDASGLAVEIEGQEKRPLPVAVAGVDRAKFERLGYSWEGDDSELKSVLRHLGYGHVGRTSPDRAIVARSALEDLLSRLWVHRVNAEIYNWQVLEEIRKLLAEAHNSVGLPDVRLWTLPVVEGKVSEVCLSPRFDVDKAVVTVPWIRAIEAEYGVRSTFYLRPVGPFYGRAEVVKYASSADVAELALHGEFMTSAERWRVDEIEAARLEKNMLSEWTGQDVHGVCMHGGELRSNQSAITPEAIDRNGFAYETSAYWIDYYHAMRARYRGQLRATPTLHRHVMDVTVPLNADFGKTLARHFVEGFERARACGGVFVPSMHPLYFGLGRYLKHPKSLARIVGFLPVFMARAATMKHGQVFANKVSESGVPGMGYENAELERIIRDRADGEG